MEEKKILAGKQRKVQRSIIDTVNENTGIVSVAQHVHQRKHTRELP